MLMVPAREADLAAFNKLAEPEKAALFHSKPRPDALTLHGLFIKENRSGENGLSSLKMRAKQVNSSLTTCLLFIGEFRGPANSLDPIFLDPPSMQVGKQQVVLKAIGASAVERREDKVGYTALMAAAEAGKKEAVEMLLASEHGKKVCLNKPDIYGHTALSRAANGHHLDICELLLDAKASLSPSRSPSPKPTPKRLPITNGQG